MTPIELHLTYHETPGEWGVHYDDGRWFAAGSSRYEAVENAIERSYDDGLVIVFRKEA